LLLFAAVAGGALAKGPFAVLFLAIITVTAPAWMQHDRHGWRPWVGWYLKAGLTGLGGGLVALVWALWAAQIGGPQYAEEIFWGQLAGRIVDAFAHQRPFWWYVPMMWVMLLPLVLWSRFWQALLPVNLRDNPRRWLFFFWVLPPFVLLSLSSGKQPHYLLPLFPAVMLLVGYALTRPAISGVEVRAIGPAIMLATLALVALVMPWFSDAYWGELLRGWNMLFVLPLFVAAGWLVVKQSVATQLRRLALTTLLLLVVIHLYARPMHPTLDFSEFSERMAALQQQGRDIAFVGKYRGEFHYYGRLQSAVTEISDVEDLAAWCEANPEAVVVNVMRELPEHGYLTMTRFRGRYDVAWGCDVVRAGDMPWR